MVKFKLSDTNICIFFMTLLVFLDMKPYFVWGQVSSVGYSIYTGIIFVTTLLLTFMLFKKVFVVGRTLSIEDTKRISFSFFVVSFGIVGLFFYQVYCSGVVGGTNQPFNMAMLCIHIGLMMFCLQDHFMLRKVFLNTKKIFAVTLIPAIVIFLLLQLGVSLPYTFIAADGGKEMTGQAYRLYFGVATMLQNQGHFLVRLCGIYQEPGFVGTVGAFFLLGDKMSFKKWENVVILLACLCTFSVAFYILIVLGWVLKALVNSQNKKRSIMGLVAVVVAVAGYFTFMSLPLDPGSGIGELQARLEITDDGLAGDNRMSSAEFAEEAYESFLRSDTKTILLGYGRDIRKVPGTNYSIWQGAHSYQEYVFNFGILGLAILVLWFIFAVLFKYKNVPKNNKRIIIVFLTVFIVSIYQRYGVANFHYLCLLFGGASNLALMNVDGKESTEKVLPNTNDMSRYRVKI